MKKKRYKKPKITIEKIKINFFYQKKESDELIYLARVLYY